MSYSLHELSGAPTAEILDGLRMLERKTSLVFTLLKASVYSIVLQQEVYSGDRGGGGAAGDGGGGEGS
jgi:DASH complex subunit DAD3